MWLGFRKFICFKRNINTVHICGQPNLFVNYIAVQTQLSYLVCWSCQALRWYFVCACAASWILASLMPVDANEIHWNTLKKIVVKCGCFKNKIQNTQDRISYCKLETISLRVFLTQQWEKCLPRAFVVLHHLICVAASTSSNACSVSAFLVFLSENFFCMKSTLDRSSHEKKHQILLYLNLKRSIQRYEIKIFIPGTNNTLSVFRSLYSPWN